MKRTTILFFLLLFSLNGISRFFSVDSDRQFVNLYSYGGNNPINGTDDDGRHFFAIVNEATGKMDILVNFQVLSSPAARSLDYADLSQQITDTWGGFQYFDEASGKSFDVNFTVTFQMVDAFDSVDNFFSDYSVTNQLKVFWAGNNYVENGTRMVLDSTAEAFVHEFGHILGLADGYFSSSKGLAEGDTRINKPFPEYVNGDNVNLMAQAIGGSVWQMDINSIGKRVMESHKINKFFLKLSGDSGNLSMSVIKRIYTKRVIRKVTDPEPD